MYKNLCFPARKLHFVIMRGPVGAADFGKLWFSVENSKVVKPSCVATQTGAASVRGSAHLCGAARDWEAAMSRASRVHMFCHFCRLLCPSSLSRFFNSQLGISLLGELLYPEFKKSQGVDLNSKQPSSLGSSQRLR
jgi:hypothetical protein